MLAFDALVRENYVHVVLRGGVAVTLGLAPGQADLMKGTTAFVGDRVKDDSIWAVLHRECHVLFRASPRSVEASTMRSSDVRDAKKVRPRVP